MDFKNPQDPGLTQLRFLALLKIKGLAKALDFNNNLRQPLTGREIRELFRDMEPQGEIWEAMFSLSEKTPIHIVENQSREYAIKEALYCAWAGVEKSRGRKTHQWLEKIITENPGETARVFLNDFRVGGTPNPGQGFDSTASLLWNACMAKMAGRLKQHEKTQSREGTELDALLKKAKSYQLDTATKLAFLLSMTDPNQLHTPVELYAGLLKISQLLSQQNTRNTAMAVGPGAKVLESYVKKLAFEKIVTTNSQVSEPAPRRPSM